MKLITRIAAIAAVASAFAAASPRAEAHYESTFFPMHVGNEWVYEHGGFAANGQYGRARGGIASILDATVKAVSQPAAQGAWPVLMAATADLPGATYVGPGGLGEMSGHPRVVTSSGLSRDEDAQRRLWELSEETTEIRYP